MHSKHFAAAQAKGASSLASVLIFSPTFAALGVPKRFVALYKKWNFSSSKDIRLIATTQGELGRLAQRELLAESPSNLQARGTVGTKSRREVVCLDSLVKCVRWDSRMVANGRSRLRFVDPARLRFESAR